MARIHARRKGKSGSKRPAVKDLSFVSISKGDVEKLVVKLYEEGNSKSLIGMILRDTYGVPDVKAYTGKTISQILKENNVEEKLPEDLAFLVERAKKVKKHLEKHKKDLHNKRGLQLIMAKIGRLSKYYKNKGVLDKKWKFS